MLCRVSLRTIWWLSRLSNVPATPDCGQYHNYQGRQLLTLYTNTQPTSYEVIELQIITPLLITAWRHSLYFFSRRGASPSDLAEQKKWQDVNVNTIARTWNSEAFSTCLTNNGKPVLTRYHVTKMKWKISVLPSTVLWLLYHSECSQCAVMTEWVCSIDLTSLYTPAHSGASGFTIFSPFIADDTQIYT